MERQVQIIEPVNTTKFEKFKKGKTKRRTCAYVRVSTDNEDQKTSYDAQKEYYEHHIKENESWMFSGIYADEGISGTSTKNRIAFNTMIEDAIKGKFDLILTKSISRFARNTVDCLSYIKELRTHNVEVFFEKENLYSFDNKVDFILTIMSSIAQEEARNISENIKWSVRKKFREGKPMLNIKYFLGYTFDNDRNLVIDQDTAPIVKKIFELFIDGYPYTAIKRYLEDQKIKTPTGKENWNPSTIKGILQNEKYKGDLLLQKTIGVDYLSHTRVANDNIAPKYYIEDNHEPIISKQDFNLVQSLIQNRKRAYKRNNNEIITNNKYPFSGILYCAHCGRTLRRRHWNKGMKSERVVLTCGDFTINKGKCRSKAINYNYMEELSSYVLNQYTKENPLVIENLMSAIKNNLSEDFLLAEIAKKEQELSNIENKLDTLIDIQISSNQEDRVLYQKKFLQLKNKYESLSDSIKILSEKRSDHRTKELRMNKIIDHLKNSSSKTQSLNVIAFKNIFSKIIKIDNENIVFIIETNEKLSKREFQNHIAEFLDKNYTIAGNYKKNELNIKFKVIQI